MILWTYKLISSARRAIAGRKYPHQLAWAVAFGLLLGVIPHGNLLAVMVLLVVLSLKINHAMAGLTAIGATFLATRLDPYSDQVGQFVLGHPQVRETATAAWALPLVPWTDLNNTVVMGSFLIGVGSLVPVFCLTYPLFRAIAPKKEAEPGLIPSSEARSQTDAASDATDAAHQLVLVDKGHATVAPPHRPATKPLPMAVSVKTASTEQSVEFKAVDDSHTASSERVAIETRIDVIRMKDHRNVNSADTPVDDGVSDAEPMDEALNYLLRQLRDSQPRKAA